MTAFVSFQVAGGFGSLTLFNSSVDASARLLSGLSKTVSFEILPALLIENDKDTVPSACFLRAFIGYFLFFSIMVRTLMRYLLDSSVKTALRCALIGVCAVLSAAALAVGSGAAVAGWSWVR